MIYKCIVADPPWLFGDHLPGKSRVAIRQYKCMPVGEIMRFPLPEIDDDAILFLWRVSSMPQEAIDVVKAWGFKPWSEIVWEKLTKNGKPWFGMGRCVRAAHETCLIAKRGKFKVANKSVRSRFSAHVPVDNDGKYIHSAKPDEFFEIVNILVGNVPRIELFARKLRENWDAQGDELPR